MLIRLAILALAVLGAIYLYRLLAPRIAADPRLRFLFSTVGLNVLRVYLLRRAVPFLLQAFRALRFFR